MTNQVELLILDIDGVLTDGTKLYGLDGLPYSKKYCDKDFTAIKRFRGAGVSVCFLSGDEKVNLNMAKNRNIPFYSARGKDKKDFIDIICDDFSVSPDNMVYVGDDLFDISIIKNVGYKFCPSDSCRDVKKICGARGILTARGGHNVVAELFDTLLDLNLITDCTMKDIENLDKQEVF